MSESELNEFLLLISEMYAEMEAKEIGTQSQREDVRFFLTENGYLQPGVY